MSKNYNTQTLEKRRLSTINKIRFAYKDKKKLKDLGEKAEKWVRKYHDVHTADFSEFILRVCLAAGLEWPRKDLAEQDS